MPREHLLDLFADIAAARGEFLVHDDGYRTRRRSYAAVADAAEAFAARLQEAGLAKGDAALLWSENRPEWIAAFWGCILAGVVVVPIDHRSSPAFASRVAGIVKARLVLVGEDVERGGPADSGAGSVDTWRLADLDWSDRRRPMPVDCTADSVAEIIFTSGATAEPKGVLITHRNLLANITPIEREILKYRAWGRPFFPLRFLNLLPMSHLFGQAMATFIPPLLPGTVVFMRGHNPAAIVRQVKETRISVIVCVPKILDVLRDYVTRTGAAVGPEPADGPGGRLRRVARRWWRHRRVHRAFGLKFWAFVVGGAPLDASLEEYWSKLGFLIIQGYGLTETAPVVSLNHPFSARRGSVGKAIGGIEVRIAPDGEILVRGENVTPGYYGDDRETAVAFEDGWLRTGDVGELDDQGQIFVRGRKKEMIVTADGLNVFPEDVERVLDAQPGVRESAVVGVGSHGDERVHAVLVVEERADVDRIVRGANAALADAQRVRSVSVWTGPQLPRTEGTRKLRRRAIRDWVETGRAPERPRTAGESVEAILARLGAGRAVSNQTTLEALGLSSLDRVELAVALEERLATTIDDSLLVGSTTLADVQALASGERRSPTTAEEDAWTMPAWNRGALARWFRRVSLAAWVLPITRLVVRLEVQGLDNLRGLDEPVVFAANHQSHLDTPAILAALPGPWRRRLAVAMAKEFFAAHFHPRGRPIQERLAYRTLYVLAALFFNAFPLPQREVGTRRALRYMGDLLAAGWSVLIYPEGQRTETGAIGRFRPGIGMIAGRLGAPVIPVRLEGLDSVLHRSWRMPRPGRVRVCFGAPIAVDGDDHAALAERVERAVRAL